MTDFNTNIKLCAYYFASESFEQGRNIIDSFIPLVEAVIRAYPQKATFSFLELKNKINETFEVNMPSATLTNLLSIMKSKGIISLDKHKRVAREKIDENYWNKRVEIESDIDTLFFDLRRFLMTKGISVSYEEAKKTVCNYIFTYTYELVDFVCGIKEKPVTHENGIEIQYIDTLCEFLFFEKEQNSINYQAFVRLYEGAIQSSLLNFTPSEVKEISLEDFSITNVILDTNFIMRVLNIQTEVEGQGAGETVVTLQSLGVNLNVLEQTICEICTAIKYFLEDSQAYNTYTRRYMRKQSIRSTGLFDAISRGATSRVKLLELTTYKRLKEILIDKGFLIIEGKSFDIPEMEIQNLIKFKDKFHYSRALAEHDLSIIHYCHSCRDKRADSLDTVKWWVLTNDFKLTYWNQLNKRFPVHECITEAQISNLLWLSRKNTYNNGLSNTMVTLANRQLLSPAEIGSFAMKMHKLVEQSKDNGNVLNKLSLVYASDCITECDIRRVNAEEQEIMDLMEEKVRQVTIETENEKLEKEIKNSTLKTTAKNVNDINNDISEHQTQLINIIESCSAVKEQIGNIRISRGNLESVREYKSSINISSARRMCAIYAVCFFLYVCVAVLAYHPISTVIGTYTKQNIDVSLMWCIFTSIGLILVYILSCFKLGTPMNPSKSFQHMKSKLIDKRVAKFAADRKYIWDGCLENTLEKLRDELDALEVDYRGKIQARQDLERTIQSKELDKAALMQTIIG